MTDEEKKEFEEFLQWKKERAAQTKAGEKDSTIPSNQESKEVAPEEIGNAGKANYSIIGWLVIALLIFFVIAGITEYRKHTSTSLQTHEVSQVSTSDAIEEVDTLAEVEVATPEPSIVTWSIMTEKDEMTDTKNIWASITSDNYIYQDFPYEGMTRAKIIVRYMKKYGYDVLIEISQGQIYGKEYNGQNYITARFDEASPKRYYFNEAADGSSEVVFLNNRSDFMKRCKQAKDIKIDIPIWQEGRPVFTFHVDEPLVWPQ